MPPSGARTPLRTLVVGHDAYRGGAQHVLLWLLRQFRRAPETRIACELLLLGEGELLPEFRSEWPTTVFERRLTPLTPDRVASLRHLASLEYALLRPVRERWSRRTALRHVARSGPFEVIFLNSAESLPIIPLLRPLVAGPIVCYIHELSSRIRPELLDQIAPHVERFVAVSAAVVGHLAASGIDPARISLVHPGIEDPAQVPPSEPGAVRAVRESLGIPEGALVVGACGILDWRKGPDIFLQVAATMARTGLGRPPHFLWLGGDLAGRPAAQLRFDAERLGVSSIVHFVGSTPDTHRYMSIMNVFFMSSREDPFPLVCLEAAALALPILYFDGSGGTREFVGTDAGLVVPSLDVPAAADAIRTLAAKPQLRAELGREAKAKVARYSTERMATDILDLLHKVARPAK